MSLAEAQVDSEDATGRGPIFVGGLSGSGKAWLCSRLSAHPSIVVTRRTYMWTRFYNRFGDLRRPDNFERCLAAMLRSRAIRALDPDPDRIRHDFRQGEPTYARLFALFHAHHAERVGKPRWADQLGHVERYADAIFAAYPTARMVHLVRDPRSRTEVSLAGRPRRPWHVGMALAEWRHSAELALRNAARYPSQYKVVRYEALLAEPEAGLREVLAFLGEAFAPAVLAQRPGDGEADEEARAEARPIGRLSRRAVAWIQSSARRQIVAHGYEIEPLRLSLGERLAYSALDRPANLVGMLAWRVTQSLA